MIQSHITQAMDLIRERWRYQQIPPAVEAAWQVVLQTEPDPKAVREAYERLAADREWIPDPAEFRAVCMAIRREKALAKSTAETLAPVTDAVAMPTDFRSNFIAGRHV